MIKIAVETRKAIVEETELITSGSVGIPVGFTFSEDWNDLSKVAVFRVGDSPDWYDIILDETATCVIPWEILKTDFEGEPVFIGVEGTDRTTNAVVVPTIWVSVGAIKPGAHSGNAEGADPTATQWSQIRMLAEQAASDAESARSAAETAEGYVEHVPIVVDDYWNVWNGTEYEPTSQKAKGDDGDPGQDGQDGFSPVVDVAPITGGHSVTITDSTSTETFDVMDGETGPAGIAVSDNEPLGDELAWIETDDVNSMVIPEIDDSEPSNNNTYSSNKIETIKSGIENTLTQLKTDTFGSINLTGTNDTGSTITAGTFFYNNGSLVRAKTDIQNGSSITIGTNAETITAGGLNALYDSFPYLVTGGVLTATFLDANAVTATIPALSGYSLVSETHILCQDNGTNSFPMITSPSNRMLYIRSNGGFDSVNTYQIQYVAVWQRN